MLNPAIQPLEKANSGERYKRASCAADSSGVGLQISPRQPAALPLGRATGGQARRSRLLLSSEQAGIAAPTPPVATVGFGIRH